MKKEDFNLLVGDLDDFETSNFSLIRDYSAVYKLIH